MGKQKEALKTAIMDEILGRFKTAKAVEGDILSRQWLYEDFLPSLSRREEEALEEILAEMIRDGIIDSTGGPKNTYRITRKGVELLCL